MRKIILVLGYGKSTKAAITLLEEQYDADIYVLDENANQENQDFSGVSLIKSIDEVPMNQVLFCLKSPGIAYSKPYIQQLLKANIDILTDVELFLSNTIGKIIAITGTNGKTTVTTLVGEVLKKQYNDVRVCGNIGLPIAEVCRDATEKTIFVVELSSFQLKGTNKFKPDIAIVLNIADAHLDYHETIEDYIKSKAQIFTKQDENDILIYNGDDSKVQTMIKSAKANLISVGTNDQADVLMTQNEIVFDKHIFQRENIHVPGIHNCYNVAYAFAVGVLCGVSENNIIKAIESFQGVKHRLQFIKKVKGISVYNDSKSTNEYAVKTALRAFDKPLVWICGGYDRGIPYNNIGESDVKNVKHMIIYGQMQPVFEEVAKKWNISYTLLDEFANVFAEAMKYSDEIDAILFSPGAASYDLFQNFEQRGDAFLQLVDEYK